MGRFQRFGLISNSLSNQNLLLLSTERDPIAPKKACFPLRFTTHAHSTREVDQSKGLVVVNQSEATRDPIGSRSAEGFLQPEQKAVSNNLA